MLKKTSILLTALSLTLALNVHATNTNIDHSLATALPHEAYRLIDESLKSVDYSMDLNLQHQAFKQPMVKGANEGLRLTTASTKLASINLADFTFTDGNLADCVLEKAAEYNWQTVADVVTLRCDGRQISSIVDLSAFTHLQVISLTNNMISDLSPLANLPMVSHLFLGSNEIDSANLAYVPSTVLDLIVSDNHIDDLSYLPSLPRLRGFHASKNNISDISPLIDKNTIEVLLLDHNHITDINPIQNMSELRTLFLQNNQLTNDLLDNDVMGENDFESMTKLTRLNLSHNLIDDIRYWRLPINLQWLMMSHNQIRDISPLSVLDYLTFVDLNFNQINDVTPLRDKSHLTTLYIAFNQIERLELLGSEQIQTLLANNNRIASVDNLHLMTKLKIAYLQYNQLYTVPAVELIENPSVINLSRNPALTCPMFRNAVVAFGQDVVVTDMPCNIDTTPLADLIFNDANFKACIMDHVRQFEEPIAYDVNILMCQNKRITDLGGAEQLVALRYLYLSYNPIVDLTPLTELTELKELNVSRNNISVLPDLSGLTGLTYLNLDFNRLSNIAPVSDLPNVQYLHLNYNAISDISPLFSLFSTLKIELNGNMLLCEDVTNLRNTLSAQVVQSGC